MEALRSRRTYDHRIQEAIFEPGDRDLFPELNIPRSSALEAGFTVARLMSFPVILPTTTVVNSSPKLIGCGV
jgi:hypothetical protein